MNATFKINVITTFLINDPRFEAKHESRHLIPPSITTTRHTHTRSRSKSKYVGKRQHNMQWMINNGVIPRWSDWTTAALTFKKKNIQKLLSRYVAFWLHAHILCHWYFTWHTKLALMHQVTSVPKQQVILHRRWTSCSSGFSSWGFRAIESHRERQPWVNYYCSKPMLRSAYVCVYGGGGGGSFTPATGVIISAQWSSICLREQGHNMHFCITQNNKHTFAFLPFFLLGLSDKSITSLPTSSSCLLLCTIMNSDAGEVTDKNKKTSFSQWFDPIKPILTQTSQSLRR